MKFSYIWLMTFILLWGQVRTQESPYSMKTEISHVDMVLNKYKPYLEKGLKEAHDFSKTNKEPKGRYYTFKRAFTLFVQNNGKVVVETGTSRSFVSSGYEGCLSNNPMYWQPSKPEVWDWGAGIFTRVAAEALRPLNPVIHTIDISSDHIERCKIITSDYQNIVRYHVCSSIDFFKNFKGKKQINLLYLDSGDICEESAMLQLSEVKVVVRKNLIAPGGLILIDDVKVPSVAAELNSKYGKAKYSIEFLLNHGYEIIEDEYQVLLQRKR